ncbi:MAG: rhomboid family intramembrane serine protease, partial [Desulfobacterales bacterium]|nr:rhomboid family intramembrane serine protease [Desulfobacterales bacterium]
HAPISFLINCIVFYFFAAPVEQHFGSKRFNTFLFVCSWRSINRACL